MPGGVRRGSGALHSVRYNERSQPEVLERRSPTGIAWSAGLRPASRGSAKPAPTTLRHANLTPANDVSPICVESRGRLGERRPPVGTAGRSPANDVSPTAQNHGDMERRSPTGIARERETRTNNAGHANLTPTNPRIANRAESRGAWSAGLRPASRGSAKPAPTTPPPANLTARSAGLRPAPLREAQRKPPKPKPA